MNGRLKSVATIGLCLVALPGCKSRLLHTRSASSQRPAADVAESKTEPTEDTSIGQASYEQFTANPNASPYGRSPYHFGASPNASAASSKRC